MFNSKPIRLLKILIMWGAVVAGSMTTFSGQPTAHAQGLCPGTDYQFFEEDGLVVIEAESQPAAGDWNLETTISGFTNSGYLQWDGNNFFDSPGNGLIEYKIRINNPGRYRFTMRSRNPTANGTEHNDLWLRFPDAEAFYGYRSQINEFVYPRGNGRGPNGTDQTPYPEGNSGDGWLKAFMNTPNTWHWAAATSDGEGHLIYAEFDRAATYTMQISGRSKLFIIDRLVLFDDDLYTAASIEPISRAETDCNGNPALSVVSTAPENNDTDVWRARDFVVTFSEPVAVSGNWFRITCPPTDVLFNLNNTVVTQNRNEFTFNPDDVMPAGFTCEVFINKNGVMDSDGAPLTNNFTFRFTGQGSAAPVLTSITPADDAQNVAINANIEITWNEAVTVKDNWFTINCEPSGVSIRVVNTVVTGSGTSRTINPDSTFSAGDTCEIALWGFRIQDSDRKGLYGGNVRYMFSIGVPENADVDEDGMVTPADVIFILNRLGTNVEVGNRRRADVNGDNIISEADADIVVALLGTDLR
ncbi:MAG: Ig-like domain-containing protein [Chloroflexota bacterium]